MKKLLIIALMIVSGMASASVSFSGNWAFDTEVNKLTDQTEFFATNTSEDKYDDYGMQKSVTLAIRCIGDNVDVFITSDKYLGADSPEVSLRLDNEPPSTSKWNKSKNSTSAFNPNPRNFLNKIMSHERIIIGFTPYNTGQVIAEFKVSGMSEMMNQMSKYCKI
ncbi:hypothetical protein [Pectobacterium betavasculorum]|uniref:hypothetical protein n=1 Tax=Pectobacterium betavasculorum TaxID=55207 RepID=UPI0012E01068|nr:hypothetical protein [Pectobacterium betavasculorum]